MTKGSPSPSSFFIWGSSFLGHWWVIGPWSFPLDFRDAARMVYHRPDSREGTGMRMWLDSRPAHYALLIAVVAALTLPNLGGPSLWDVDEGVNAEAAREMREADTWIIPTFNFELRTAKP